MRKESDRRRRFRDEVSAEERRRLRAQQDPEGVWFGLGMMGLIGWSVSVPTLAGLALGIWIDSATGTEISWTLTGLFAGVMIGCLTAWYWVRHEREETEDRYE